MRLLIAFLVLTCVPALRADLSRAKSEQNLERRSRLALENAERVLKSARTSYESGDIKRTTLLLEEVLTSVELAEDALRDTGKDARKKPKHFKHAEKETRELLRHLESFKNAMSVADRAGIRKVQTRINEIHDDLLDAIMGEKP